MTLLSVSAITHQYMHLSVLKEVSLALKSGETVALLGREKYPRAPAGWPGIAHSG